ncbi:hypothetical protein ACJX0J_041688, partial [Zea mays]
PIRRVPPQTPAASAPPAPSILLSPSASAASGRMSRRPCRRSSTCCPRTPLRGGPAQMARRRLRRQEPAPPVPHGRRPRHAPPERPQAPIHTEYSSFLIWTVGTQGLLCNPLSTVALTLALWRFFSKQ